MEKLIRNIVIALLIVLIGGLYGCGNGQEKTEETQPQSEENIKQTVLSPDSVEIAYNVYGQGNHVLVLVHCWCGDSRYWHAQVEAFKDDYKIVTLDLAGHGESGLNREKWDMAHYGGDVAAVINTLNPEDDVILVGHSMGGPVCIEAARQLPGRITAIVGVDTFQDLAYKYSADQVDMFMKPMRDNYRLTTIKFVQSIVGPEADTGLVNWIIRDMVATPEEVAVNSMDELLRYDVLTSLKEMRVPIRAINAELFPTNAEGNDTLASSFKVLLVPTVGHFVQMEDPETFNADLRQTLAEFWPEK